MIIKYGCCLENSIDVTLTCLSRLLQGDIITIPSGDLNRGEYFSDPVPGVVKKVFIQHDNGWDTYLDVHTIKINLLNNEVKAINEHEILLSLHQKLKINHGTFDDEFPEQKMVVKYFTGNEKVLEIGGNIGRNSLIMASLLNNQNHLVVLESEKSLAQQLLQNRDMNHLTFHVENSALSTRKLIQKDWLTVPSDTLEPGYSWVNIISWDELQTKYQILFDTLVLDCEGAFYYILKDMPYILDNICLIIMENDYHDVLQKEYVDQILREKGFFRDHVESGGWGPCYSMFFEVWKK